MAKVGENEEKNNALIDQNQEILRKIFEKCKYESIHGLQRPLELYKERVLYYTDTSEHSLNTALGVKNDAFHPDLFDRAVINDTLKALYAQHKPFSFNDIYEKIKEKVKVPDINSFCHTMKQFRYKLVNSNYGHIIVEDPKVTYERFRYLKKITKSRDSGKEIYYIDERVINMNKTLKKPWLDCEDVTKMEGYVFFHIISKTGLEKGLFCNQANAEDFSKWISDIVISFIKASSVIIMDDNPLHGKTVNEPISRHSSKDDMLKWLQRNNIPCSPSMRKPELYDLIARCPIKDRQYQLDLVFQSHGHEVLRLPKNYHDLSMTELLWEHIRSSAFSLETDNIFSLKNKVYNAIASIRYDKWLQFESIIKDTEKNIFVVDEAIEQALDSYQIDPDDVV